MKHHILMGDVIGSAKRNPTELRRQLKRLMIDCNQRLSRSILSPYTITLGDEFQGVSKSILGVIETIFYIEEEILRNRYEFKLHYVAHFGNIDTKINRSIAYEMMGPGLTRARSLLTKHQRMRPRFIFDYGDTEANKVLNNLFYVIEHLIDHWRIRDFELVMALIDSLSNAEVALKQRRDRTAIWRRRKTLRIDEYILQKQAIFGLIRLFKQEFTRVAIV